MLILFIGRNIYLPVLRNICISLVVYRLYDTSTLRSLRCVMRKWYERKNTYRCVVLFSACWPVLVFYTNGDTHKQGARIHTT